ncbi:MAG: hypothetical protein U0Y10_18495 [Spirosomataceae bacterium]
MKKFSLLLTIILCISLMAHAQYKDGKLYLNESGSHYVKLTFLNQTWLRYNNSNPGTTVNGFDQPSTWDVGLRRTRLQFFGQLTDHAFFYFQVGQNNFNYLSDRKTGFFIHDALGEINFSKQFSLGGGLTGWSGLARFASPSVGSILGVDAPLFEQATADATDQFLRKLSVYAKGKLGKLDYRIALSDPFSFQKSPLYNSASPISKYANFSTRLPNWQQEAYIQYQFLDQEANITPYTTGTYYGAKRIFNIGVGMINQPNATWNYADNGKDTLSNNMTLWAIDAFYDAPVNKEKGTAISAYLTYCNYNFGPGYLRNVAPMNPATGNRNAAILNGAGNGFPMIGTGDVVYGQVGYKFKNNLLSKRGTLMPYASGQFANYQRLSGWYGFYDIGVNWLLSGSTSKLTLAYQNRPIFTATGTSGNYQETDRRGTVILQYQVFFN